LMLGMPAATAPDREPTAPRNPPLTLTWGWALYVVVPFLLFVAACRVPSAAAHLRGDS